MEPFVGSLLLSLRLVLPGWIWGGLPAAATEDGEERSFWMRLGRAVAVGLLLNLLPALTLAGLRIWTPVADWIVWAGIVAAGVARARRKGRALDPAAAFAALALVGLLSSLPLFFAPRSEWLAGGWDPGIYQNNAVVIARQNGLQDRAESIYSAMSPDERALFTRSDGDYHEILPSVPIRIEDGSIPLYFFHLTPVCGAWFLRMGGTALLFRLPAILALWGLLPALALFGLVGFGGWRRWAALVPWLLSPMWWYQQAIPTAEMLYLLLLLSGLLLYLRAARRGAAVPLGAMGALFAAVANHFNFAILAGALLAVAAAIEADLRAPGRRARIGLGFAAVGLGILWNLAFADVIVLRLEIQDRALSLILSGFVAAALLSWALVRRPLPAAVRSGALRGLRTAAVVLAGAAAVVALCVGTDATRCGMAAAAQRIPWAGLLLNGALKIVSFHGIPGFVWACAGVAWLALCRSPSKNPLKAVMAALGVVCVVLFLHPGIAQLYPWATRRPFAFLVPFLALAQAFVLVRSLEKLRASRSRWFALVPILLLPAGIFSARLCLAAARVGDYPGFERTLAALERALEPGDVIVADGPEWGTPLMLAGGHDVVSGRRLWRSDDPDYQRRYMETLARARNASGRRFLWLTSTDAGLALYPVEPGVRSGPLAEIAYEFRVVNHGERARSYETQPGRSLFRLYEWDGTFRLRSDPPAAGAPPP